MSVLSKWLEEKTFHHSQFSNIKQLVDIKEKKGITISLCIPTLNEESTIGKEIVIFNSELRQRYPLLDEIVVIDSGSSDKTLEVATSFGADTYLSSDILPHLPSKKGKGENLWKAVYQLKGDIIVYIDADIKNIHSRFVYGLVAPLLFYDEVEYVKAFYDRPLSFSQGVRPSGGGRVTEILIRPLFSLFYPELTGIIQPLSGEYAARRGVLEKIPFPVGYGVETAHIMDIYNLVKDSNILSGRELNAFAQVDLDMRVHRNQPTLGLGKMAFGILQTFLGRAERSGDVSLIKKYSTVLRQFQASGEKYEALEYTIIEDERPPMQSIKEYREFYKNI